MHPRESCRCNPDDGELHAPESDASPDDVRIGSELIGPRVVSEHEHRVSSGHAVLVWKKETPECWLETEHVEEVAADDQAEFALSRLVSPVGEAVTTML